MATKPQPPERDIAKRTSAPTPIAANPEVRFPFSFADIQRSDPDGVLPKFEEKDGNKHLAEPSNGTASCVRFSLIPLESEARRAMEEAQQEKAKGNNVSIGNIRNGFPAIKYYANEKEIGELRTSSPGFPDPRKWAVGVLANRLQLPPETISKYARKSEKKK